MAFERVAATSEIWDGDMGGYVVRGKKVLLVHLHGSFYAYENRCAHLGIPLHDGRLADGVIRCNAHHYEYDACTGRGINPTAACLRAYPVTAKDGWVTVDVTEDPT